MGLRRSLFAALKHVVPSDLENYLEEKNSEGLRLCPLGQGSVFSFRFIEEKPEKLKYVVDCPTINKHSYMKKLTEEGWELMGSCLNCYVWRKSYEDGPRPEDFSDRAGQRTHCLNMGLIFLFFALVFCGILIALISMLVKQGQIESLEPAKIAQYALLMVVHLPFIFVFGRAAIKLLKELPVLDRKIRLKNSLRRSHEKEEREKI
ncbi:MAG: DUF2812 domain-containing protein [Lachnospiraceae bacterium]|nr:DUF2812 domain-containing protein [Lachnospiraceae bacterium]